MLSLEGLQHPNPEDEVEILPPGIADQLAAEVKTETICNLNRLVYLELDVRYVRLGGKETRVGRATDGVRKGLPRADGVRVGEPNVHRILRLWLPVRIVEDSIAQLGPFLPIIFRLAQHLFLVVAPGEHGHLQLERHFLYQLAEVEMELRQLLMKRAQILMPPAEEVLILVLAEVEEIGIHQRNRAYGVAKGEVDFGGKILRDGNESPGVDKEPVGRNGEVGLQVPRGGREASVPHMAALELAGELYVQRAGSGARWRRGALWCRRLLGDGQTGKPHAQHE